MSCSFCPLRSQFHSFIFRFAVRCFSHVLIIFCICCRSIKCIVCFGARGFGVTKVVKFILQLFFPSLLLFILSISASPFCTSALILFLQWINVLIRISYTLQNMCFFLFHLPRIIYCFRCNFILFAVRLCFFIFTINIIGFCCCCCCRSFYECCVWISGVCVCFFPHLFNQNAYFALHRQQFIFFSCKKKVFARFISLFPLYTIDDSSIAAFVPRSSLTCYECERTKQRFTN